MLFMATTGSPASRMRLTRRLSACSRLTISSRAEGGLEPVNADALTLLAASGLAQLP